MLLRITYLWKALLLRAGSARLCESFCRNAEVSGALAGFVPPVTQFSRTLRAARDNGLSSPAHTACSIPEFLNNAESVFIVKMRTALRRFRKYSLPEKSDNLGELNVYNG